MRNDRPANVGSQRFVEAAEVYHPAFAILALDCAQPAPAVRQFAGNVGFKNGGSRLVGEIENRAAPCLRHLPAKRKADGWSREDETRRRSRGSGRVGARAVAGHDLEPRAGRGEGLTDHVHRRIFDKDTVSGIKKHTRRQIERALDTSDGNDLVGFAMNSSHVPKVGRKGSLKAAMAMQEIAASRAAELFHEQPA